MLLKTRQFGRFIPFLSHMFTLIDYLLGNNVHLTQDYSINSRAYEGDRWEMRKSGRQR